MEGRNFSVVFTPADMKRWSPNRYMEMSKWVQANGIKPQDVSVAHPLSIEYIDNQDVIRYYRIERNSAGGASYDTATGVVIATPQLTPLKVWPPR